jgi:signal transduction histidine kinase
VAQEQKHQWGIREQTWVKVSTLRNLLRYWAVISVVGLGTGVSIVLALLVGRWEITNTRTRFDRQTENLTTALQRSLNRYTEILRSMEDLYRASPTPIDRATFATFVERTVLTYPGIQALEWSPLVRQVDRSSFEQRIRNQGFQRFQITELHSRTLIRAADRPDYFPVAYIEPLLSNEAALGFDLASNPVRRAAMQSARDTGQITATGRIRLVQEPKDQFAFLVVLPIYQNRNIPDSVRDRQQQLQGFLLGVFRISDVVEESLQGLNYRVDFEIRDQTTVNAGDRFLGFYQSNQKTVFTDAEDRLSEAQLKYLCSSQVECTRTITVAGRQWSILFVPTDFYFGNPPYGAAATLMIGFLLTAMLSLLLLNYQSELQKTQEMSDLKLRFFSMASHELRTPLSTILLTVQSLQGQVNLTEPQQKSLQRVQQAAQRMTQQIIDILTLTRAEVGKLEFIPEIIELDRFCQQIVDEFQTTATQKINFVSDSQNIKAYLDKKLMRSMITNLLSNAIKYSPENSTIDVSLFCHSVIVSLQVSDRGIGIPANDLPRLYEAFYRASNAKEISGTGLGLALVKTCVDLHRGSIQIESTLNEGTTIRVNLPID